ncbi:hypothetical protein CECT5772_02538 [Streptococcus equi subsp. ruminatorum CECT 5772]|uniref:Uncharacterized protein n=1 Tax=Streptococcus equi subsp. ruminatorum CECT 5772 TaxID=1051981 RepID=A0A922NVS9_9STRE|nr:hypothetical protein CECT5772_02538 [Streptococcus equi subsp. ruminatorum CECT 5772]
MKFLMILLSKPPRATKKDLKSSLKPGLIPSHVILRDDLF